MISTGKDQDSDCWGILWQHIKVNVARFLKIYFKT